MKNNTTRQILICVLLYSVIGSIHMFVHQKQFPEAEPSLLLAQYGGYFLFAGFVLGLLLYYFEKTSQYLGFLYLMTSALKFGLFYFLVWPYFTEDNHVEMHEKMSFLIPYFSTLVMETYILISKMNKF